MLMVAGSEIKACTWSTRAEKYHLGLVILSEAPRESFTDVADWRAVEGS
jgi:hypothetical protein